jgi:hypothetical protein
MYSARNCIFAIVVVLRHAAWCELKLPVFINLAPRLGFFDLDGAGVSR